MGRPVRLVIGKLFYFVLHRALLYHAPHNLGDKPKMLSARRALFEITEEWKDRRVRLVIAMTYFRISFAYPSAPSCVLVILIRVFTD